MAVNINDALSAYRAAARTAQGGAGPEVAPAPSGSSFGAMVRDALETGVAESRQAETQSMKAIAGEADLRDVVMAVNSAEVTLQTVVAIRDRVVNAYNQILRMPI